MAHSFRYLFFDKPRNPKMKKPKWLLCCHLFSYQNLLQIVDDKSTKSEQSKKNSPCQSESSHRRSGGDWQVYWPKLSSKSEQPPQSRRNPLPPTPETVSQESGESGAQGGVGVVHGGGVDGAENGDEGG